jgi:hypothetical protein
MKWCHNDVVVPQRSFVRVSREWSTPMPLAARISEELLPYVRGPAQYIGREINQLVGDGDWSRAEVRVALGFPDAYTIGMSHLGSEILYWLCNHTPGVCAERVYSPWTDAEAVMRRKRIPLFTWDTRQLVSAADIFAVSLQYEMGFTNLLLMLDLAGIPLRSRQRDDSHPLVIAGGPQADNPEPVADFLDLVVMGDGEHAMAAILELTKRLKSEGVPRRDHGRAISMDLCPLVVRSVLRRRGHDLRRACRRHRAGAAWADRAVSDAGPGGRSVPGATAGAVRRYRSRSHGG